LATGLEQQATVADLVPAAVDRFNQPFNLPAGKVLPVADFQHRPTRISRPPPPGFSVLAPFIILSIVAPPLAEWPFRIPAPG
jgi:hypothetical protein